MSLAPIREAPPTTVTTSQRPWELGRVLGVSMGHFLNDFHISWLGILLPPLILRFNLSLALAGLLGTILISTASLSQPFFGLAADRLRRGLLAALGPAITAIGMSLTGVMPAYVGLIAVLLLAGVGTAAFHPQGASLAGFLSGRRRITGMSIFVAAGELAFALGPIYIASMVQWRGLGWTLVAGAPGIMAAVLLATYMRGWATAAPVARGTVSGSVAIRRRLFVLWLYTVMRSIIVISFITFLPLLLRQRGVSLVMGGTAVFLFGGIGAIGGLLGGFVAERVGRRATLVLSLVGSVPLLALYLQSQVGWALLLLPVTGIILYLSVPVTVVMAQEALPQRASLASSIVMGLAWGMGGLALTAVGAAADRFGLRATLLATLSLAAVAVAVVAFITPPRNSSQDGVTASSEDGVTASSEDGVMASSEDGVTVSLEEA